jgi:hypothetical protein
LPCSRGRACARVIPHLAAPWGVACPGTGTNRPASGRALSCCPSRALSGRRGSWGRSSAPWGRRRSISYGHGPPVAAGTAIDGGPPGDGGRVSRRTTSLVPSVLAGTRGWDVQRASGDDAVRSRLNRRGDRCSEISRAALTGGTSPGEGPRREPVLSAGWACPTVDLDSRALDSRR